MSGCCSICEHPVEGWTPQSFPSGCFFRKWDVAGTNHWLEESARVRSLPPAHENNCLSRPDRQTLRGAGDNTQLEHNTLGVADSEIPRGRRADRLSWERGQSNN